MSIENKLNRDHRRIEIELLFDKTEGQNQIS